MNRHCRRPDEARCGEGTPEVEFRSSILSCIFKDIFCELKTRPKAENQANHQSIN